MTRSKMHATASLCSGLYLIDRRHVNLHRTDWARQEVRDKPYRESGKFSKLNAQTQNTTNEILQTPDHTSINRHKPQINYKAYVPMVEAQISREQDKISKICTSWQSQAKRSILKWSWWSLPPPGGWNKSHSGLVSARKQKGVFSKMSKYSFKLKSQ